MFALSSGLHNKRVPCPCCDLKRKREIKAEAAGLSLKTRLGNDTRRLWYAGSCPEAST